MKSGYFEFNWPLVGNSHIKEFLEKSIIKDEVEGVYILNGPNDLGKFKTAKYFAQSLLCNNLKEKSGQLPCCNCDSCKAFFEKDDNENYCTHGDFSIIKKEEDKKNISIEQIRGFINSLSMTSFFNSYKIGIIKNAETLSIEAYNALLKTLEEPKQKIVIILISNNLESLPATIISRSRVLNFYPVKSEEICEYLINKYETPESSARIFSKLCSGRPDLAIKFLNDEDFLKDYKDKVSLLLDFSKQDMSERFFAIENSIGKKSSGQEAVQIARDILEIWQGVIRDLLLQKFDLKELVRNQDCEQDMKNEFDFEKLSKLNDKINQGKIYLDSNVGPKLVLENIAINF